LTSKRLARAGLTVASTAAITIGSSSVNVSPAIFHSGARFLQWPHHGAKNSTRIPFSPPFSIHDNHISFAFLLVVLLMIVIPANRLSKDSSLRSTTALYDI